VADQEIESDDPRLSAAARHALHDEELVAAFAVDGDEADDPARARALIERCSTCRDLHADLIAIGATIAATGTAEAVAAIRPAGRDFRLSASDAVRLRGGNAVQRWTARFLDGLATFGRPVGASLAALGVVGLLVGSIGLGQLGVAGLAGGPTAAGAPGSATFEVAGNEAAASPITDRTVSGPIATQREDATSKAPGGVDTALGAATTIPLLLFGSILIVVLGLALLIGGTRRRRLVPVRRSNRT
jgi:hypothetical protein